MTEKESLLHIVRSEKLGELCFAADKQITDRWEKCAATSLFWHDKKDNVWLKESAGAWNGYGTDGARVYPLCRKQWSAWTETLDLREEPFVRWFRDGFTNIAFNELDRWILEGKNPAVQDLLDSDFILQTHEKS